MHQFEDYNLDCPKCGAKAGLARLEIVSGHFSTRGMALEKDGFSFGGAYPFDTEGELVFCNACKQSFKLSLCRRAFHTQTIELRELDQVVDGMLRATTEILGVPMRVIFIKVEDNDCGIQVVRGKSLPHDYYDLLCKMDPGGDFRTVNLPGYDGEWVMFLIPTKR